MQVLHPQSMRPAREGDIPVRVKNSYNPQAPGTLITRTRDMSKVKYISYFLHFGRCIEDCLICITDLVKS
jgi:aspartate kinase